MQFEVGQFNELSSRSAMRENANERAASRLVVAMRRPMRFDKDRARRAPLDAAGAFAQQLPGIGRPPRDGEIELRILQRLRQSPVLPDADLLAQPLSQPRGKERTTVEEHGVNGGTIAQKRREMPRDRAVGRIGKSPLPHRAGKTPGTIGRQALGEESFEDHPLQLCARHRRGKRVGEDARAAAWNRNCKGFVRRGLAIT